MFGIGQVAEEGSFHSLRVQMELFTSGRVVGLRQRIVIIKKVNNQSVRYEFGDTDMVLE